MEPVSNGLIPEPEEDRLRVSRSKLADGESLEGKAEDFDGSIS